MATSKITPEIQAKIDEARRRRREMKEQRKSGKTIRDIPSGAPENGAPEAPTPFHAPVIPDAPDVVDTVVSSEPAPFVSVTPHQSFCSWLRTPKGMDCTDPRFPSDYSRMCVELEDRLRAAFEAGWIEAGKQANL